MPSAFPPLFSHSQQPSIQREVQTWHKYCSPALACAHVYKTKMLSVVRSGEGAAVIVASKAGLGSQFCCLHSKLQVGFPASYSLLSA